MSAGTTCPWRPVERCLDNNPYTDCRTDEEPNPWIVLRYDTTIQVTEVALTKVRYPGEYSVHVTDTMPEKGEVVTTGNRNILQYTPGLVYYNYAKWIVCN